MAKVISAAQAAELVQDGQTLGVQGFICTSVPEDLIQALATRYRETSCPKGITLFYESSIGDNAEGGMNALALDGLVGELHCAHLGTAPKMAAMVNANKFPAYLVPQGVNAQLLVAIAGKKPGVITHVGLKTYADPRVEGCKVNDAARAAGKEVVELVSFDGQEYLRYFPRHLDICFIRGTSADELGNLTIDKEALEFDQFEMAAATRNCGGIVVAQVERVVEHGTLKPHECVVPGALIDYLVVAAPKNHRQCSIDDAYHPEWSGEARIPLTTMRSVELTERKVCARRAAFLLRKGDHMNLGIGMPEVVSAVVAEEGFSDAVVLSVECGLFGGVPLGGLRIGCGHNPDSILSQVNTFDIYDGGGIDVAVLGAAEVDQLGNVNVSRFNGRIVGPGGFINITQSTQTVAFVGTFTAGGCKFAIGDGKLVIENEGRFIKFKQQVEQITFSGEYGAETGKNVLYITERAVFQLVKGGIRLIEIAPGIDLEKDVLGQMEFRPIIADDLKEMDPRIFTAAPMGLTV
jgi:propionate CoA-transferase